MKSFERSTNLNVGGTEISAVVYLYDKIESGDEEVFGWFEYEIEGIKFAEEFGSNLKNLILKLKLLNLFELFKVTLLW